MWPAHRAAQQQARTVQETGGETGFSTGGAETGTSLIEPESQTHWMKEREEGGVIRVRKNTECALDEGLGTDK